MHSFQHNGISGCSVPSDSKVALVYFVECVRCIKSLVLCSVLKITGHFCLSLFKA